MESFAVLILGLLMGCALGLAWAAALWRRP